MNSILGVIIIALGLLGLYANYKSKNAKADVRDHYLKPRACANCKHWQNGECHRSPPQVFTSTYYTSWMKHPDFKETYTTQNWVQTGANDTCGEFSRKERIK